MCAENVLDKENILGAIVEEPERFMEKKNSMENPAYILYEYITSAGFGGGSSKQFLEIFFNR